MQRWMVLAAPAAQPWVPSYTSMLSKQAELSLLAGDFDHFDDDRGELLPEKEVSCQPLVSQEALCVLGHLLLNHVVPTSQLLQQGVC